MVELVASAVNEARAGPRAAGCLFGVGLSKILLAYLGRAGFPFTCIFPDIVVLGT